MDVNAKLLSERLANIVESRNAFKRATHHNEMVFTPETQGIQKSINITSHINKPKEISHMSVQIDAKKCIWQKSIIFFILKLILKKEVPVFLVVNICVRAYLLSHSLCLLKPKGSLTLNSWVPGARAFKSGYSQSPLLFNMSEPEISRLKEKANSSLF